MPREIAERLLDTLSSLICRLSELRDALEDPVDRSELNRQIRALSHLWREIDDRRASLPEPELAEAVEAIGRIARELRDESEQLRDVAEIIRRAAQVIAIAEKLVREVT